MNKVVLMVILVMLGVVLIVGGLNLMNNRNSEGAIEDNSPTPETSETTNSFSGTLLDLLAMGQDKVCTFDNTDETGIRTEGTVYLASGGDRLSSEFTVHQTDGSFDGSIVRDGEYTYIWTTLQEQGVKIEITPESESIFGEWAEGEHNTTGMSDDTEIDFNCSDWQVDNSMFVPPSDVEFVDISDSFSQLQNMMGGQCSACEELPAGEVREQCMAALNCN